MQKYELSKDWLKKNTEKVKFGYSIASGRSYDLKSAKDVLEVLKVVDPENANEENAKIFSGILELFSHRVKKKFEPKPKTKSKIVH